MGQTAVRVFFHSRHTDLGAELNGWFGAVAGQIVIRAISMDSNDYGHCLTVLYEAAEPGRLYRAYIFHGSRHGELEREANQGLQKAEAHWGRFVTTGSNQYGHCVCVVEEQ